MCNYYTQKLCINFDTIKQYFITRKHMPMEESKYSVIRVAMTFMWYVILLISLHTEREREIGVVIQFYFGSVCVSLIIALQREFILAV